MLTEPFDQKRIRRTTRDGVTYYSLVDIVREFSSTEDEARRYWYDTKQRLRRDGFQLSAVVRQLKLPSVDGKSYKTDVADAETCMRIIQSIPSPKAEPIRQWLARIAVERLEETADPDLGLRRARERAVQTYKNHGRDDKWIASRLKGIDDRHAFTDALKAHVADISSKLYAQATNQLYRGLWGRDAEQLRRDLALPNGTSIRDHQPRIALHYQSIVETVVTTMLEDRQVVTEREALQIIRQVAGLIGAQASELGALMGVDPATWRKPGELAS